MCYDTLFTFELRCDFGWGWLHYDFLVTFVASFRVDDDVCFVIALSLGYVCVFCVCCAFMGLGGLGLCGFLLAVVFWDLFCLYLCWLLCGLLVRCY